MLTGRRVGLGAEDVRHDTGTRRYHPRIQDFHAWQRKESIAVLTSVRAREADGLGARVPATGDFELGAAHLREGPLTGWSAIFQWQHSVTHEELCSGVLGCLGQSLE